MQILLSGIIATRATVRPSVVLKPLVRFFFFWEARQAHSSAERAAYSCKVFLVGLCQYRPLNIATRGADAWLNYEPIKRFVARVFILQARQLQAEARKHAKHSAAAIHHLAFIYLFTSAIRGLVIESNVRREMWDGKRFFFPFLEFFFPSWGWNLAIHFIVVSNGWAWLTHPDSPFKCKWLFSSPASSSASGPETPFKTWCTMDSMHDEFCSLPLRSLSFFSFSPQWHVRHMFSRLNDSQHAGHVRRPICERACLSHDTLLMLLDAACYGVAPWVGVQPL